MADTATAPEHTSAGLPTRVAGWTTLVTGLAGLLAAGMLVIEKIHLLENPDAHLICDLGLFVTCGPVMSSPAAALFGFPNPILGLVCFTIAVTSGVLMLTGSRLPQWYWTAFAGGTILGGVFITWLQYQSIFVIGALCAWCMIVWASMIPMLVTAVSNALTLRGEDAPGARFGRFLSSNIIVIVAVWYLVIVGTILAMFADQIWA